MEIPVATGEPPWSAGRLTAMAHPTREADTTMDGVGARVLRWSGWTVLFVVTALEVLTMGDALHIGRGDGNRANVNRRWGMMPTRAA